jgi:H+/Cl- antiporter ClcA
MITAVLMAIINFCTIYIISFVVKWKFSTLQAMIDSHGLWYGVVALMCICGLLATLCAILVTCNPMAGGSGAPENKGWLNGNSIPGLFTFKNLWCRALATMLANTAGYPVGREGPTVTMGSNLAFLITDFLAMPWLRQWVDVQEYSAHQVENLAVNDERYVHVKRMVCTVGGACGMAMLFDSPIGGIIYMFEEISSTSWPMEVTFRAFAGTSVCALVSRGLLNLCGTSTKAFVVYEWNPHPQRWTWGDMPYFALLAAFLGVFSAFHTRACLKVAQWRQTVMGWLRRCQPTPKIVDAIMYGVLCALTYSLVAWWCGKCEKLPKLEVHFPLNQPDPDVEGEAEESEIFVRYNCKEGFYSPIASLLLTTSEGAVKRLFSRKNEQELHFNNELRAFLAYSTLNICLTGVPVPSGNFTGSMLIGGLAGRLMGAWVRDYWGQRDLAVTGVYAMVGAASMLCGFKQMAVAVVVFITGCANDPSLIPPLMLSVTVSLVLNQLINERGFDEEQILRKNIPYLLNEMPQAMEGTVAKDLIDQYPPEVVLREEEATYENIRAALDNEQAKEVADFPVLRSKSNICMGFATRARLQAALDALEAREEQRVQQPGMIVLRSNSEAEEEGEEIEGRKYSGELGRRASLQSLPVTSLAEPCPHTVLENMPASRVYDLFAKAGVRAASVVTEVGEFRGMISRTGLIATARRVEHGTFTPSRVFELPAFRPTSPWRQESGGGRCVVDNSEGEGEGGRESEDDSANDNIEQIEEGRQTLLRNGYKECYEEGSG